MHYVRLKQNHQLTLEETDLIRNMELKTPKERWPLSENSSDSDLIEIYKQGTLEECREFILNITDNDLAAQFEIIS